VILSGLRSKKALTPFVKSFAIEAFSLCFNLIALDTQLKLQNVRCPRVMTANAVMMVLTSIIELGAFDM